MKKSEIAILMLIGLITTESYGQSQEENKFKQLIQEFPFARAVYVQEKHEVQQTGKYRHNESDDNTDNIAGYEIEYGIINGFQISTGYGYSHSFTEDGSYYINSLQAGTMFSFLNTSKNELALSIDADFPLNSLPSENEEDTPSVSSTLIYAIQFGKTQLHVNAGAELQNEKVTWFYNAAAVYGTGHWHPILELNTINEDDFNAYLGPGVDVTCDSGWELSTGIRHGLNNNQWAASVNLIYEFTAGSKS